MSSGTKKNSIAFSSSWCLTEPNAFSRSNQMTGSSVLLFFAIFIRSHNIVVCSIHPGKLGTPAFWIDVLTYPLFIYIYIYIYVCVCVCVLCVCVCVCVYVCMYMCDIIHRGQKYYNLICNGKCFSSRRKTHKIACAMHRYLNYVVL